MRKKYIEGYLPEDGRSLFGTPQARRASCLIGSPRSRTRLASEIGIAQGQAKHSVTRALADGSLAGASVPPSLQLRQQTLERYLTFGNEGNPVFGEGWFSSL